MYYNLFLLLNVLSRSIFCDFKVFLEITLHEIPYNISSKAFSKSCCAINTEWSYWKQNVHRKGPPISTCFISMSPYFLGIYQYQALF